MVSVRRLPTADLTAAELREVRELLEDAFDHEGDGFGDQDWEHALGGVHAIVEVGGRIVSHASLVPRVLEVGGRSLRTGYVEAVATRPDLERRGYGSIAIRNLNEVVRAGYELGALSTGLLEFYARLGWEPWRGPTWVRGPQGPLRTEEEDGTIMVLRTTLTGDLDFDAALACDWREGDAW